MKNNLSLLVLLAGAWTQTGNNLPATSIASTPPPAGYQYVVVKVPTSCLSTLWCSCSSTGSGSRGSSLGALPVVVGGGGSSNPKGKEVLEFLLFEQLSDVEKTAFRNSAFASATLKDPNRYEAFKKELDKPVAEDQFFTVLQPDRSLQKPLLEIKEGIEKIEDAKKKEKLQDKVNKLEKELRKN